VSLLERACGAPSGGAAAITVNSLSSRLEALEAQLHKLLQTHPELASSKVGSRIRLQDLLPAAELLHLHEEKVANCDALCRELKGLCEIEGVIEQKEISPSAVLDREIKLVNALHERRRLSSEIRALVAVYAEHIDAVGALLVEQQESS